MVGLLLEVLQLVQKLVENNTYTVQGRGMTSALSGDDCLTTQRRV